jgi:hypothetical protein
MEQFYLFIIRNDIWIYFLCGLALTWYGFQFIQARSLLRRAMFGLEQERGRQSQRSSLIMIVILLAVIGGVTYVNIEVLPTLPPDLLYPPTPTPNPFATPFLPGSGFGTAEPEETPTLAIAPTVTLRGQSSNPIFEDIDITGVPTNTPLPTLPPLAEACNSNADITSPPTGIIATGPVTFFGTATTGDFSSYDLLAIGPQTDGEWISLLVSPGTEPILDGILGRFNFSNWASGDYNIRLIVKDRTGQEVEECGIGITLDTGDVQPTELPGLTTPAP